MLAREIEHSDLTVVRYNRGWRRNGAPDRTALASSMRRRSPAAPCAARPRNNPPPPAPPGGAIHRPFAFGVSKDEGRAGPMTPTQSLSPLVPTFLGANPYS
jgi:hypothetical protein